MPLNNSTRQSDRRHPYRSQITRRLLLQYLLSIVGFAVGFVVLILVAWQFCAGIAWQESDPLYRVLNWIKEYLLLWTGLILLAGWVVITYHFMAKPLRYLDELVTASEQLAQPSESPILLPDAMKTVQDELNLVREQALRNALLAKDAEKRKNDLIVYLAHDLKTPLTSVIGYLTLLRDEPQVSQELRAKYTGIALDKAERLEDLINEFFDITRFSLSNLSLELERVNLSRLLEQVTYEFLPILTEKSLSWDLRLAPDIWVVCDPAKLERVLDNLLRNAVHYSFPASVIGVSLETVQKGVQIRVQNQGQTIPAEKLERIFDQFFRLDASRATTTGGAGLGLAIAKEIIELHSGAITAECMGETVAFTVLLPVNCQKNV